MTRPLIYLLITAALVACNSEKAQDANKNNATVTKAEQTTPATTDAPQDTKPTGMLDAGKIVQTPVTSKGSGITPGAAVNEALKNAVIQVNGVTVDAASTNLNVVANAVATVDTYSNRGHDHAKATATLQGQAYADQIITQSNGIVSSFKILNIVTPAKDGDLFVVDIEARIAKFAAPADSGKIKIVIAPLRAKQQTFDIGGRSIPAREILDTIQRQIVDALTQTGRFTVLDRQFGAEIQGELDMIAAGETPKTDLAKMGQALSADLIWVGEINTFAFSRHARQLQTSERELVSYSGGWSVSQRIINATTRQIHQSATLQGAAPGVAPTTLSQGVDGNQILTRMQSDLIQKTTESILLRSFPISIIERNGNQVVLSQGGTILREKARYRVFVLGKELKDPQTGQSLGNMESPCCDLVIDRVMPTMSYATLQNVQIGLDNLAPGSLQLREQLPPATVENSQSIATAKKSERGEKKSTTKSDENKSGPKSKEKERDDW